MINSANPCDHKIFTRAAGGLPSGGKLLGTNVFNIQGTAKESQDQGCQVGLFENF